MIDAGKLVVARYRDGRLVAGRLDEFRAEESVFQVQRPDGAKESIEVAELKALFFVRSLEGDGNYDEHRAFPDHSVGGTKTWVEFHDGEELAGWELTRLLLDDGIFLFPTDAKSNIEKAYIPRRSLRRVLFGEDAETAARKYPNRRLRGTMLVSPENWDELIRQQ